MKTTHNMKNIFLFLCILLIGCNDTDSVIPDYEFLVGTWIEYKPMEVTYIDTNKKYDLKDSIHTDTISFTPSYELIDIRKQNGNWASTHISYIYSLDNYFTTTGDDFYNITIDGINIISEIHDSDSNIRFLHYYKKISKEWRLDYLFIDIKQ